MRGSCLCGIVRYEIDGPIKEMSHCHCSMCRKSHGAAFGTYAQIEAKDLRFTHGADKLKRFRSSEQVERGFCSECGSRLLFLFAGLPDRAWVAAGTFDEDPGVRPS